MAARETVRRRRVINISDADWDRWDEIVELPADQQLAALRAAFADRPPVFATMQSMLLHRDVEDGLFNDEHLDERRQLARVVVPADLPNLTKQVVAGRYAIGEPIGEGGAGVVYAAKDLPTGRDVAVKLLPPATERRWQSARNEVAMLRLLRMPGVVPMLDDGRVEGPPGYDYVVMERIQGEPFPGADGAVLWDAIAPTIRALLETIDRIHWTGIIHRDLKPGNVLVSADGVPTVLDVGLSQDRRRTLRYGAGVGTTMYMPPEQRQRGEVSQQSDLFAIGVMIFQALTGRPPYAEDAHDHMQAMNHLRSVASGLPANATQLVSGLIEPRRSDRLASATDARMLLEGEDAQATETRLRTLGVQGGGDAVLSAHELRRWFAGRDRLTHIHEDGAQELFIRTQGRAATALKQLDSWQRAGLGRWEQGHFAMTRSHLGQLKHGVRTVATRPTSDTISTPLDLEDKRLMLAAELAGSYATIPLLDEILDTDPDGTPARIAALVELGLLELAEGVVVVRSAPPHDSDFSSEIRAIHARLARALPVGSYQRLSHWVAAGERDAIPREADATAQVLEAQGEFALAQVVVEEGLRALNDGSANDLRTRLLLRAIRYAMNIVSARSLEYALYLIEVNEPTPLAQRLEHLVRAMMEIGAGRVESALQCMPKLESAESDNERRMIASVLGMASRFLPSEDREPAIAAIERIAEARDSEILRNTARSEQAWRHYSAEEFEASAALHMAISASTEYPNQHADARSNAASSYLEAGMFDLAESNATLATEYFERLRIPIREARSIWIVRAAQYRRGDLMAPDTDLADAAIELGESNQVAMILLNEAAIAWRALLPDIGRRLAREAARIWTTLGATDPEVVARALALACTSAPDVSEGRAILAHSSAKFPTTTFQAAGLVAQALPSLRHAAAQVVRTLKEAIVHLDSQQRLEVTSLAEAMKSVEAIP